MLRYPFYCIGVAGIILLSHSPNPMRTCFPLTMPSAWPVILTVSPSSKKPRFTAPSAPRDKGVLPLLLASRREPTEDMSWKLVQGFAVSTLFCCCCFQTHSLPRPLKKNQLNYSTGPLIVPLPQRSPGLMLQPLTEWWASCCLKVQYMYLKLVLQMVYSVWEPSAKHRGEGFKTRTEIVGGEILTRHSGVQLDIVCVPGAVRVT